MVSTTTASQLERYVVAMRCNSGVRKPGSSGLPWGLHRWSPEPFIHVGLSVEACEEPVHQYLCSRTNRRNHTLLRVCTVHARISNARIVVVRRTWEESRGSIGRASLASRRWVPAENG